MSTYGYGRRTFVQALAKLCCRVSKYLSKHDAKLRTYLPPAAYTCITGTIGCLNTICDLLNISAR